ncbi:MAG: type VI secretion system membrane subunit TssM [Candidatus Contendobacter odensis]|uniref:Type VI secretion system membrane subunit TssM n=1 Tax=Candidatus Contendibacter odensensis TaxID=1400860 RepID=A0A2G6PFV9_9GAMM|nr:MAG: type VI secretion system membrane subunit TssM [Candidatus Contendobacter odensis]
MRKVLNLIKKPWFIAIIGFMALVALIWYLGPLISVAGSSPLTSDLGRIVTILVFGVSIGLYKVIYYIQTLRNNRNMLSDLVNQMDSGGQGAAAEQASREQQRRQEEEAASAEEISTLKQGLDEALSVLKRARLGGKTGRGQYLYQLPWYIIIGPPGSGKTTALIHSGLRFPLGAGKVRGVGGTRNCDWWFTDEAVILDTAGRYTTQDSHEEVDRAAWRGFLDLLKKHRRRRPVNGAFVAISLIDLMQQTEEERTAQAVAVKHRIQELHEHFGIRFPIYVLFTKADLMAGFIEFFNNLRKEERAQVWGTTFLMDDSSGPEGVIEGHESVIDGYNSEFDGLQQRLNDRLTERLQEERDPQRRDLIYGFPKQFGSIRKVTGQFLQDVFQPNRYEEQVLLRGVYFTSGTQTGRPIDRLMNSIASTFGLQRRASSAFSGKGRSYFITRLLQDVVFPESEIAGTNLRVERWRAWLQRGAYAGALLITVLAAGLWVTSYARNEMYVRSVEKQRLEVENRIRALPASQSDPAATLALLDAARTIPGGYDDRDAGVPWLMGFGLYQGKKLGQEAQAIYEKLLIDAFLPRIILRMEERLRQNTDNPGYLYDTLRVYQMMDHSDHFDAATIKDWMEREWQAHLPRSFTQEHRKHLAMHLDALLKKAPLQSPIALDNALIRQIQKRLNQVPLAQRIYERLKQIQRVNGTPPMMGLTLAAGPDAPRVFERKSGQPMNTGIAGLYTYKGYYQFFLGESSKLIVEQADESWILGPSQQITNSPNDLQRIAQQVCRLYLGDFLQQWQNLLADVQIKSFDQLDTGLETLQVLSSPLSPLRTLMETVAHETALQIPPTTTTPDTEKPAGKAATGTASLKDRISGIWGDGTEADSKASQTVKIEPCVIDRQLLNFNAQYQREVKGANGAIPPLDKMVSAINDLYGHANAVARARSSNAEGKVPQALKDQLESVINQLQVGTAHQPPPFNTLLSRLAKDSSDVVRSLRDRLNDHWKAARIAVFFKENLHGRYPLVRSSIQWSGGQSATSAAVPVNSIQWTDPGLNAKPLRRNKVAGPPDATLTAFGQFFGPNGLMDSFFKQYLQKHVDTSQGVWQWRGSTSAEERITPEALQAFQRAAAIRDALFSGDSQIPSIRFQMTPLELNGGVNQFIIDIGGQKLSYRSGQAARTVALRWPGQQQQARIEFKPPTPGAASRLSETGSWAWFKILDQAQVQPLGGGQLRVLFQLGGQQAMYKLQTAGQSNPFRLRELEGFRCPSQL